MCTSAALHWLMAMMLRPKTTFSSDEVVDCVMRYAAEQYTRVQLAQNPAERLLSHDDVIAHRPLPPCMHKSTHNGHYLDLTQEESTLFDNAVFVPEIASRIAPNAGCLVTANAHTVAVHRAGDGSLWLFDSLPAYERRVGESCLAPALQAALSGPTPFKVCDITIINPTSTDPSEPTRAVPPSSQSHSEARPASQPLASSTRRRIGSCTDDRSHAAAGGGLR